MEALVMLFVCFVFASLCFPGQSTRVDPEYKYRDYRLAPEDNEYSVSYLDN